MNVNRIFFNRIVTLLHNNGTYNGMLKKGPFGAYVDCSGKKIYLQLGDVLVIDGQSYNVKK